MPVTGGTPTSHIFSTGTISTTEAKACLDAAAAGQHDIDLPDPIAWADLVAAGDTMAATVRRRLADGTSPGPVQILRWPKNRTGGWRQMATMDPFDLVTYRALVGRHALGLDGAVDRSSVLSSRLAAPPPGWRVESHKVPVGKRRGRGMKLLEASGVLGTLDIWDFYAQVTAPALETLRPAAGSDLDFNVLLGWLAALHDGSEVTGLPIGPGGSELLGTALLAPGDAVIAATGFPYLRYMDDTWVFMSDEAAFAPVLYDYAAAVGTPALGLTCHPTKCRTLVGDAARDEIRSSVLQYADVRYGEPGADRHDIAMDLFRYAIDDPDAREPELRAALGRIDPGRAVEVFDRLVAEVSLLALAPTQWRRFLTVLLGNKKVCRHTDAREWLLEQVTRPVTNDSAYQATLLVQAAGQGGVKPAKSAASGLLDAAVAAQATAPTVQAGVAHLWSRSDGYNPRQAVDAVEAAPTTATRRGFAITLDARRTSRGMAAWIDGVRNADPDLQATADWLAAAA